MQLLLTDACSQKQKPQIAMVGATVQAGVAATAADMVSACAAALSSGRTHKVACPCSTCKGCEHSNRRRRNPCLLLCSRARRLLGSNTLLHGGPH